MILLGFLLIHNELADWVPSGRLSGTAKRHWHTVRPFAGRLKALILNVSRPNVQPGPQQTESYSQVNPEPQPETPPPILAKLPEIPSTDLCFDFASILGGSSSSAEYVFCVYNDERPL